MHNYWQYYLAKLLGGQAHFVRPFFPFAIYIDDLSNLNAPERKQLFQILRKVRRHRDNSRRHYLAKTIKKMFSNE